MDIMAQTPFLRRGYDLLTYRPSDEKKAAHQKLGEPLCAPMAS